MIAIAESGSTKCQWIVVDNSGIVVQRFKTIGFNPDFHTEDQVKTVLLSNPEVQKHNTKIEKLYFYGAGCSSSKLKQVIHNGLTSVFPVSKILVDHDLLSAAYSLYNGKPIIACILGTGSNSCYFDGVQLSQSVPSLGFLLGDEGGGGYFGKKLLKAYYYNKLPECMAADFKSSYKMDWEDCRKKLYKEVDPNVFAASFMPFLAKHIMQPYSAELIKYGFSRFVDIHVNSFPNAKECEISFVGSVAFYFQDILKEVLKEKGLLFGQIIQSPADELVNYHLKYILKDQLIQNALTKTTEVKIKNHHI